MFNLDYSHPCKVHFIGIGGISMSGLAVILAKRGFSVTGSDATLTPLTDSLAAHGIKVMAGSDPSHIPADCDMVVYTAAIHPDDPEYAEAVKRKLPLINRADLLGTIMKNYSLSIGVAGTHGKTTTTSMLAHILLAANTHPTISVGGVLPAIGGNIHIEEGDVFLAEACEYTNSFLSLFPTMELILNIEEDHLDFFKDIEDIRHSFRRFMDLLPSHGHLIIHRTIDRLKELTDGLACRIITFAEEAPEAGDDRGVLDYSACDITCDDYNHHSFTVMETDKAGSRPLGRITLKVSGRHNVSNALAAIAAAKACGIAFEDIAKGLTAFTGTNRRFQFRGKFHDAAVIDDYAHHPDEIRATLTTAKAIPHKKLWVAFQSHTYTRTKALLPEFISALSMADEVVVAPIYPARETDSLGMSPRLRADLLKEKGTPATPCQNFEEIKNFFIHNLTPGDLLITMGAGPIDHVADLLLSDTCS